jgi:hypothetical protein
LELSRIDLLVLAALALVLAASPAVLADEPEIDPVELQTLSNIGSVVMVIEAYRIDHGAAPVPTDGLEPVEILLPFVEPFYVRSLPLHDGWGRELRYWSDGNRFVVVSFGPDGLADQQYAGVTAADLQDRGDDLVVVDSVVAAVPLHLRPVVRAGEQKATMADMRSIGTCVEAYRIDSGSFPGPTPGQVDAAWMRELVKSSSRKGVQIRVLSPAPMF